MNKFTVLKIVNPLLAAAFLIQAATGIMLAFTIGIDYMEQISVLHKYNGLAFIALAAFHLTLNWSWITANYFKKRI